MNESIDRVKELPTFQTLVAEIETSSLSPEQYRAICLLATGENEKTTANLTGVTVAKLRKWKTHPDFKKLIRLAVIEVFNCSLTKLVFASTTAVDELYNIMTNEALPARTRLDAIKVLLEYSAKTRDFAVEERLEQIERKFDDYKNQN